MRRTIPQNKLTLTTEEGNIINTQLLRDLEKELDPQTIIEYSELFKDISHEYEIYNFYKDLYYSEIGNVLLQKGNYDPALYAYMQSLKINQNYIDAYIDIGRIFEHNGKNDKALAFFNKAITFQYNKSNNITKNQTKANITDATKSVANAYYHKALLLYKNENLEETLKNLQEAIEFNPYSINTYLQKILIFENLGNFDKVIQNYDEVIKHTRYSDKYISINAYYQKAEIYAKMGNLSNSIQSCDTFIKEKLRYEDTNKYAKAYISLYPNAPLVSNSKYDPPSVQTSYSEAYSLKQKALALENNLKESYYCSALSAFYSQKYGDAIKLFDLAEEYINGLSYSFRVLCACMKGQAYSAINDEAKALEYFKKASELTEEVDYLREAYDLAKEVNSNDIKEAYATEIKNLSGIKKDLINKLKDLQEQIIEASKLPESEFTYNYIKERYDLNSSIIENFTAQIMLDTDNKSFSEILTKQIDSVIEKKLQIDISEPIEETPMVVDEEVPLTGLNKQFEDLNIEEMP